MANNLIAFRPTLPTPSLTSRVAEWTHFGTINYQGQRPRHYLTRGALPEDVREEATTQLATLSSALDPMGSFAGLPADEAKLGIVNTLMMGLAVGKASEAAIDARMDLFEMALDDVPAWAVAEAVRRWVKRACPPSIDKNPNYTWPPAPQTLRAMAYDVIAPYVCTMDMLRKLLSAETKDAAFDERPAAVSVLAPASWLKRM